MIWLEVREQLSHCSLFALVYAFLSVGYSAVMADQVLNWLHMQLCLNYETESDVRWVIYATISHYWLSVCALKLC